MRLVSIYWVLAADRVAQAEGNNPDDAAFILKLAQDIDVARMENAFIWTSVEDWDRLLRLVPEARREVRPPPTMEAMQAKRKALELKTPFSPRSGAPLTVVEPKPEGEPN